MSEYTFNNLLILCFPQKGKHLFYGIVLFLLAFALYFPSLFSSFCLDDAILFTASYPKNIQDIPSLLTEPVHCRVMDYYRPVSFLSFVLDYNLWEKNPLGYHISNIILSALSCYLVFLFSHIFLTQRQAFLSSVLFLVYPGHCEAVLGIYNRSQILSTIFILAALLCFRQFYTKNWGWKEGLTGSTLCTLAGCLSKENAIVLPLLSLLLFITDKEQKLSLFKSFWGILLQGIACSLYLALRYNALGTWGVHEVDPFLPSGQIYFNASRIYFHYLFFAFFPYPLSSDYPWNIVDFHWTGLLLPIVLLLALCFFFQKKYRLYLFAFFFFSINLIPVLHIFPLQIAFAERFLYSAYPGICIIWVLIFRRIQNKYLPLLLIFPMAFLTFQRNFDWKDNDTLWKSTLKTTPQSYRAYIYLGSQAGKEKKYEEALELYEEALKRTPNRQNLLLIEYNKALIFLLQGQTKKAKEHLGKVMELYEDHAESLILLGDIALEENQKEKSLLYYEKATKRIHRFSPGYLSLIEKIAKILVLQKEYPKALTLYEEMLTLTKDKESLYPRLAFLYIEQKDFTKAQEYLEKMQPNEYSTLYLLYLFYHNQGNSKKAQEYFQKARQKK